MIATDLIYNKTALAQMEGIDPEDVLRLEVWANCIFVIIRGRRPRFYSKQAFLIHFVEWRKASARDLAVAKNSFNPSYYSVSSEAKGIGYKVHLYTGGAGCNCEDFKNQARFFGNACCRHIYAAIAQLGHNWLSEYIAA